MPYFSWENYVFKKWPKYKKAIIQCVLTERNTGKTYGTYAYSKKYAFTPENKVLMLRNTDTELKKSKKDFADRFRNQYLVKNDFIYNIVQEEIEKDGEKITVEKAGQVVGYFASINNYINYKSLEADRVTIVIYEEFNEDTVIGRNIYFKFFNLLKTFERFNKLKYVFMLGNKDGFDSDFFINWNIIPNDDISKNKITEIRDDQGLLGVVYDLGNNDFLDLDNAATLSNRLAALDNRTLNYSLGGFQKEHSRRVMNYKKIIPTFSHHVYLTIGENRYALGKFEKGYALLSPWNVAEYESKPSYAFDNMGGLDTNSTVLDEKDHQELLDFIFANEKALKIWYDSYDSRQQVRDLLALHTRYIRKS